MAISQNASILVVDDQASSSAVTQSILQKLGFTLIDQVQSASVAIEQVRKRRYDVIISDWHMAPINGPDFLKELKRVAGAKCPKFFFLTMDAGWGCMVTARDLGADGLLVKPSRPIDLLGRLSKAFGLR